MSKLVTKESLTALFESTNEDKRIRAVGRALVAVFNNQTRDEQSSNDTNQDNGIGFTGSDARAGSISAKYYLKHGTMLDWQVEQWTKLNARGTMRLAKYHRQLNEIAVARATAKEG